MNHINEKSPERFHIMVVEDEELIRDMIQQNIEWAGYECTIAKSGIEALEILAGDSKKVHIIITDIRMPGLSGIELTKKIKENYDSDVIVMTGFAEDFDYEKVIESGASDFFQKPINSKELMLRLKRVLKERILLAERNRADKELKKNIQKLQNAQEQTVAALASTTEIRDPYTSGHQKNVTKIACSIAEHMGLSAELIKGLHIAGLLHDIGKISVPTEILSKPGKITKDERNIIKNHCRVGHDILKGIEFQWPVAKIVLQHHERMDGSGYPLGIQGEEILLEARILAVADVIEAMSSHRPYRAALGLDEALAEIRKNRGVLFDPVVVDACLELAASGKLNFDQT
jgi:putative two-component system response regulator